jgi:hypothetical protein
VVERGLVDAPSSSNQRTTLPCSVVSTTARAGTQVPSTRYAISAMPASRAPAPNPTQVKISTTASTAASMSLIHPCPSATKMSQGPQKRPLISV